MQVLVFCEFGLKTPIHAPLLGGDGGWGTFPPNNVTHCPNPKRGVPGPVNNIDGVTTDHIAYDLSFRFIAVFLAPISRENSLLECVTYSRQLLRSQLMHSVTRNDN